MDDSSSGAPVAGDRGRTLLKGLIAFSVLSTGLHFTHNFVEIDQYPDGLVGGEIIQLAILVSWPLLTAVGFVGYRLYARGRCGAAQPWLVGYSLLGLSTLGHFLDGNPDIAAFWYATIFTDAIAGAAILVFALRSARQPSARTLPAATLLAGAVAAASCALPASAAGSSPADFSLTFDSTKPSTPADVGLHIVFKDPQDPDNPYRGQELTSVTIAAPKGTVFDGAAVPACGASNEQLMAQGPAACPAASRVGGGFGSVISGFGPPFDPFYLDVHLFNFGGGVIELFTFEDSDTTAAIVRAHFTDQSTMVLDPTEASQGLPIGVSREFSFTYHAVGSAAGQAFITTPPDCPASGSWTSQLIWTIRSGTTYSASASSPCSPAGKGAEDACKGKAATLAGDSDENLIKGTPGPDVIMAGAGDDTVKAGGGDDVVCGRGGKDRLRGGSGNDLIRGGRGSDRLAGSAGSDECRGGRNRDAYSGCELER